MKRYIVEYEMETRRNQEITTTIIGLVCKNKEEAQELYLERQGRYKKLQIIEEDIADQ